MFDFVIDLVGLKHSPSLKIELMRHLRITHSSFCFELLGSQGNLQNCVMNDNSIGVYTLSI